jgi:hypothetical protein
MIYVTWRNDIVDPMDHDLHYDRSEREMNMSNNIRTAKPARIVSTKPDRSIEELSASISAWAKKADEVARQAAELEQIVVRARGTRDFAKPIGDDAPASVLQAEVERLLAIKPRTHQELVTLTGARTNRISGIVFRLYETGAVRNTGLPHRALWTYVKTATNKPTAKKG